MSEQTGTVRILPNTGDIEFGCPYCHTMQIVLLPPVQRAAPALLEALEGLLAVDVLRLPGMRCPYCELTLHHHAACPIVYGRVAIREAKGGEA